MTDEIVTWPTREWVEQKFNEVPIEVRKHFDKDPQREWYIRILMRMTQQEAEAFFEHAKAGQVQTRAAPHPFAAASEAPLASVPSLHLYHCLLCPLHSLCDQNGQDEHRVQIRVRKCACGVFVAQALVSNDWVKVGHYWAEERWPFGLCPVVDYSIDTLKESELKRMRKFPRASQPQFDCDCCQRPNPNRSVHLPNYFAECGVGFKPPRI